MRPYHTKIIAIMAPLLILFACSGKASKRGLTFNPESATKNVAATKTIGAQSAKTGAPCETKVEFAEDVQPIFEKKCMSCHTGSGVGAPFMLLKGPISDFNNAEQNYSSVVKRINTLVTADSLLLQKVAGLVSHGPNSQPILPRGSEDYETVHDWIDNEATCQAQVTKSNLARSSAEVMLMRLSALFPLSNVVAAGEARYTSLLQPTQFDVFAATGLMRGIASSNRNFTPASQIALRGQISQLCNLYNTVNTNMFSETDLLLPKEALPTDPATRLAFAAARNSWLYPYEAGSSEVAALVDVYKKGKAAPFKSLTPDATGRLMVCVAALVAPQFWIGNPGDDDVVRRVALEIGRVLPKMSDFAEFRQAADKTAFIGAFTHNLQTLPATKKNYLSAVKSWHKDWLGLRDFVGGGGTDRTNLTSAAGPGGFVSVNEDLLLPAATGLSSVAIKAHVKFANETTQLSESCTPGKIQNFDIETTKLVWEHFNHSNNTWEVIGSWVKSGSTWSQQSGEITLANGSKRTTTLADITVPKIGTNLKNQYVTGSLVGTPVDDYAQNERRVRRFTAGGEQDGYSLVRTWYGNQSVYTCNTMSRIIFACAFRPSVVPPNYANAAGWNASLNMPNAGRAQYPLDSLVHPLVLDNYRCGNPDTNMIAKWGTADYNESTAYPRGTTGAYNTLAYNSYGLVFQPNNADHNPEIFPTAVSAHPEARARGRLERDLLQETNYLIDYILSNNVDYRQLLTANFTFGGAELDLYYRQAGQWIPTYPAGYVVPANEADAKILRTITNLPLIPFSTLASGWGCAAGMPCPLSTPASSWPVQVRDYKDAGGIPGRMMSGILTQASFLGPISVNNAKARSISARVFSRLMCGLPSEFLPALDANGISLSKTFMQTRETSAALHLDESKGCYSCHVLLDPIAAIFNKRFLTTTTGTQNPAIGEVMPYYAFNINLLGVVGGGGKSSGAFLGKPVTGIAALGSELANSNQFARCTVKQAFMNVFGRDPSGPDFAVIDRVSGEFTSKLKYDYNLMVEELVKTPEFMRGN